MSSGIASTSSWGICNMSKKQVWSSDQTILHYMITWTVLPDNISGNTSRDQLYRMILQHMIMWPDTLSDNTALYNHITDVLPDSTLA